MNRDFPAGEWAMPIELAREPDFRLGRMLIRPAAREVEVGSGRERLEPRVMQALVALAQRKGAVVTKDELVQRCWGGRAVGEDAINRCIAKARKLAEFDGGQSFRLETIPRIGLRLTECAVPEPSSPAEPTSGNKAPSDEHTRTSFPQLHALRAGLGGLALIAIVAALLFLLSRPHQQAAPVVQTAEILPPGAAFRDCAIGCPEMVVIPSGYFMMGSARNENGEPTIDLAERADESPKHEDLIQHRFALGRYDVTRGEYARFATETNRTNNGQCYTLAPTGLYVETLTASWRHPGFGQTDRDPVVCVSWYDAKDYVDWLSRRTGKRYRLPSEAELEYATRAGSEAARTGEGSTGANCRAFNGADSDYHLVYPGDALYESDCRDGFVNTSPGGSFPANAFGLFDTLGNAAQWTADCYHDSYDGAPTDGSPWITGDCEKRIVRGGSWESDARNIRFASRYSGVATSRYDANGFRVARDL